MVTQLGVIGSQRAEKIRLKDSNSKRWFPVLVKERKKERKKKGEIAHNVAITVRGARACGQAGREALALPQN